MARPCEDAAPAHVPISVIVVPFHTNACSAAVGVDVLPVTQPLALMAEAMLLPPPREPRSVSLPPLETNARVKAL